MAFQKSKSLPKTTSIPGRRYGRWKILCVIGTLKNRTIVLAKCACEIGRLVDLNDLRRGKSKSCGCWRSDRMRELHRDHPELWFRCSGSNRPRGRKKI